MNQTLPPYYVEKAGSFIADRRRERRMAKTTTRTDSAYGVRDPEAFAHNLARMVEEAGKAASAYLKPREEGKASVRFPTASTDVVKTLTKVGEYWLAEPERDDRGASAGCGPATSTCGRRSLKRMMGEPAKPAAEARPARQALRRPGLAAEPVLRFHQAGLPDHQPLGRGDWPSDADGPRPAHPPEGRLLRQADRQRARAVEFRPHQPGAAARDAGHRTATNLVRGMHMLAEDIKAGGGDLKIRQSDAAQTSSSARTSRRRPARSSTRTTSASSSSTRRRPRRC